jgi:hypothetical protein
MPIVQKIAPADLQNYFGWSHPISDIPVDKSNAVLIEGLGGAAVDAVKAYTEVKKQGLEEEVQKTVYPARDKEIDTLLDIREKLRKGGLTTGDVEDVTGTSATPPVSKPPLAYNEESPTAPVSMVSTTGPQVYAQADPTEAPAEVQDLGAELDARKQSLDQNKISRTEFMRDMYMKAQRMRAENPKWVDVIDKEFGRILGTDPANATMASTIRDINSMVAQTQRADPVLQDLRWAIKQGFPNADLYLKAYKEKRIDQDKVYEFINKEGFQFYQGRLREQGARKSEMDQKDRARDATDRFRTEGAKIANNYFSALRMEAGLNTPEELLALVTRIQNGTLKVTDEEVVVLANSIRAAKVNAQAQMLEMARRIPEDGRSMERDMGPQEVKRETEASLALFDEVEKLITDKQVGAAFMAQSIAEAIGRDDHLGLLRDTKFAPFARVLGALRKNIGDNYLAQFATKHLTSSPEFTAGINDYISVHKAGSLVTQDLRTQAGVSNSLNDAILKARRAGVSNPKVYEGLLDITKEIANPELKGPGGDAAKVNAAKWAFDSSKNKGLFTNFAKDIINNDGSVVPGAFRAFQRLTSPDIAKEINRLDGTPGGQGLKNMYINFVQQTAGVELLRSEFNTMDAFFNDPNLRVAFNKGTGHFEVHFVPQSRGPVIDALRINKSTVDVLRASQEEIRGIPSVHRGMVDTARDIFGRINMGISSLKSTADSLGLDSNGFILQTIAASRQGGDVPRVMRDQLEKAIINSTGSVKSIKGDKEGSVPKRVKTETYRKPKE